MKIKVIEEMNAHSKVSASAYWKWGITLLTDLSKLMPTNKLSKQDLWHSTSIPPLT